VTSSHSSGWKRRNSKLCTTAANSALSNGFRKLPPPLWLVTLTPLPIVNRTISSPKTFQNYKLKLNFNSQSKLLYHSTGILHTISCRCDMPSIFYCSRNLQTGESERTLHVSCEKHWCVFPVNLKKISYLKEKCDFVVVVVVFFLLI